MVDEKKYPTYRRHQLSLPLQIEAPIPIKYACRVIKKIINKKNGIGVGGKGEGLINEKSGTDHVIRGPMRGLKKLHGEGTT